MALLRPARGAAVPPAELGDYTGVYAMTFGAAPIVSVPLSRVASARLTVVDWEAGAVREPGQVAALLGKRAGEVVGPASVAYADGRTLRPSGAGAGGQVRMLDPSDSRDVTAVAGLRAASPGPGWKHGEPARAGHQRAS